MSKKPAKLGWVLGTVVALGTVAHAQAPGWSRGQQELPITWEECVKRANAAMQAEGYRIDQPSPFVVGAKAAHTAVIMCNPSPTQKQWVNIVVASNSEGGGVERQRLQARMEGQAQAQPPGPPAPPPVAGEGRCAGADYSVSVDPVAPRAGQKLTIRFTWKGKMLANDWIAISRAGDPPERYVYEGWRYTNDMKDTCAWNRDRPLEAGNYVVSYMIDNSNKVAASVPFTVTAGATSQVIQPPPPPAPAAKPVQYMGCFRDSNNPFDLDGHLERSGQNTPQRCIQVCAAKGFAYAGVQYGQSCLCGNRYGTQGQANNCNMACTGDARAVCGGSNANSVYSTGR
ncbi:MAG: WSC domain-containing protein [Myxococcales bacterium]|nr:WSC domain-containing protein [Myxococcales bacterium]